MRAAIPSAVPVLRPAILPSALRSDVAELLYARQAGDQWMYAVTYHGDGSGAAVTFAMGPVNATNPNGTRAVEVRGANATLATSAGSPHVMVFWHESGHLYSVYANDLSEDEILRIAQSTRPM